MKRNNYKESEIYQEVNEGIEYQRLKNILDKMECYTVCEPDYTDTERLIEKIYREINSDESTNRLILNTLLLIKEQFQVNKPWFWLINIALVVAGIFIHPLDSRLNPLVYMLSFGMISSISFLFYYDSGAYQEIILSCPISREQLALARLLLAVSIQVLLYILLGFLRITLAGLGFSLVTVNYLSFLIPLLFFGSLTLFFCLRSGTITGFTAGSTVWLIMIAAHYYLNRDIWSVFNFSFLNNLFYLFLAFVLIYFSIVKPIINEVKR